MKLLLFTPDPVAAHEAVAGGVDGIVIDWEHAGKRHRQQHADTEINEDTVDDLRRIRGATSAPVLCRVNPLGVTTETEIEAAVEAGADEVLLPMVRRPEDVERALELVRGRIGVGILIETIPAVERAAELGRLPVSRVYAGLNDLAIERGTTTIFVALVDGTIERLRRSVSAPFGVAGMTVVDAGDPVPSRLLIAELARLGCDFTFLRRSFRRDVLGRELPVEIAGMKDAFAAASRRSELEITRDHSELERVIGDLETLAEPAAIRAHG